VHPQLRYSFYPASLPDLLQIKKIKRETTTTKHLHESDKALKKKKRMREESL